MNRNLISCLIFCSIFLSINCSGQSRKPVGGGCEGCEAIFEFGEKTLTNVDTLPGFDSTEPKLKLTGTVFQRDGKTPAKDVILYVYHTDRTGIYPKKGMKPVGRDDMDISEAGSKQIKAGAILFTLSARRPTLTDPNRNTFI